MTALRVLASYVCRGSYAGWWPPKPSRNVHIAGAVGKSVKFSDRAGSQATATELNPANQRLEFQEDRG